jgi:hypothetical protein
MGKPLWRAQRVVLLTSHYKNGHGSGAQGLSSRPSNTGNRVIAFDESPRDSLVELRIALEGIILDESSQLPTARKSEGVAMLGSC